MSEKIKKSKNKFSLYFNWGILSIVIITNIFLGIFGNQYFASTRIEFLGIGLIALGFLIYSIIKKKNTFVATLIIVLISTFHITSANNSIINLPNKAIFVNNSSN